jgi:hypothetical protein
MKRLASALLFLCACDTHAPRPPAAADTTVAPASSPTAAPTAQPTASAAAKAPKPQQWGQVALKLTGALSLTIESDGAQCSGNDLWLRSNDLVGFGTKPRFTLLYDDGRLALQVGPFAKMEVFDTKTTLTGEGPISLDHDLVSEKGKKVHIEGKITCAREPAKNSVPERIVKSLKAAAGSDVRRYATFEFGRGRNLRAISAVVPKAKSKAVLSTIRKQLGPGWVAFIGTSRWLGEEKHEDAVEIVVGPGRDQFDILRHARSNALNYDMGTEALVKKLRAWDALADIDIFHAETDTIEFTIGKLPADLSKWAADMYAFCPDIVDQGVGSVEKLEKALRLTKEGYLWWD